MNIQKKSLFTPPPVVKPRKGFTLAEVLITLVVIGIIAAITVPLLMANHKKTEYSGRLKKFYSTLSNAVKLAEREWGVDTLDLGYGGGGSSVTLKEWFEKYLAQYISYIKTEELSSDSKYYQSLNMYDSFKSLNSNLFVVYLNDGSLYFNDEASDLIVYDVNGEKGPNTYGRDLFYFYILTGVESYYQMNYMSHVNTVCFSRLLNADGSEYYSYSRSELINRCKNQQQCAGCSKLLENDGWEFKDDYPYRL